MTKLSTLRTLILISGLAFTSALLPAPALAVDDISSTDGPDLTAVRAKIKANDFAGALHELRDIAEDSQNAEIYNLIGFTLRKTGDLNTSLSYYIRALELKPDFKAAHEYLGELYVETRDLEKAKEQVAALERLCPGGCEELDDLQTAITAKPAN
jgi:Flp pilus assembly protein TadD